MIVRSVLVSTPENWICLVFGEVIVPVLSKTNVSISANCSIAAVFFMKNLFLSNMLSAADRVNGELSAKAQGQAIIKTAVKAPHALPDSPFIIQNRAEPIAIVNKAIVKFLLIALLKVWNFLS